MAHQFRKLASNLSVYLMKKVASFARANCARTCSDWLALTELSGGAAKKATLPWKKGDLARRITILAETNFHVNGSPSLVRKMKKSWSAQGSAVG